jgi:hypothetical protein
LQLGHDEYRTKRIGLRQRVLDPLGEAFGLTWQRGDPSGEPLAGRLPDAVHCEDDANDARRVVDHALEQRQPLSLAKERQQAGSCESAPGQRGILYPRGG